MAGCAMVRLDLVRILRKLKRIWDRLDKAERKGVNGKAADDCQVGWRECVK